MTRSNFLYRRREQYNILYDRTPRCNIIPCIYPIILFFPAASPCNIADTYGHIRRINRCKRIDELPVNGHLLFVLRRDDGFICALPRERGWRTSEQHRPRSSAAISSSARDRKCHGSMYVVEWPSTSSSVPWG